MTLEMVPMMAQKTSGSTLSQELIKFIEVNRDEIDGYRRATGTIEVTHGILLVWTWAVEKRRGKEIDYL